MTTLVAMLRMWKVRLESSYIMEKELKCNAFVCSCYPRRTLSLRLKIQLGDRTDSRRREHRAPARAERYKGFVPK